MDCCSEGSALSVDQAQQRVLDGVAVREGSHALPLEHSYGRILSQPVRAPLDVPPADNSAMDGFACRHEDLAEQRCLPEAGQAFAGQPFNGQLPEGQCVRIMTGAVIPEGANTVVMREQVHETARGIEFPTGAKLGQNIRRRGEDMQQGQEVLQTGRRINAADIGLLASLGIAEIQAYRPISIALLSTGDELQQPGQRLDKGQIYDSNRPMLKAALTAAGFDVLDLGVIPDDTAKLEAAFRQAQSQADAIITSGGVSVGDADYTTDILQQSGEVNFWKLAIKPGKPFAFGHLNQRPFFGLPGNPVSALVTCQLLVLPALKKMAGYRHWQPDYIDAVSDDDLKKRPGRTDFQRGQLFTDDTGQLRVRSTGAQGSALMTSISQANCLIRLPQDSGPVAAGSSVRVLPFYELAGL